MLNIITKFSPHVSILLWFFFCITIYTYDDNITHKKAEYSLKSKLRISSKRKLKIKIINNVLPINKFELRNL